MARPSIGWTAGAWLTICAGLAAAVAYQLVNSFPLAPTVTAAPPSTPLLELAERPGPPRSPGADAVDEIAARPLFSADRRPYVPPPAPAEEVVEKVEAPLPLELAGTFLTATDQAALILVTGRSPEWLRTGQSIDGWKIGGIAEDRVQLLKGNQERNLYLREDVAAPQEARASARQAARESDHAPKGDNPSSSDDTSLRELARRFNDNRHPAAESDDKESD